MKSSDLIESFRFWDVVTLWARERLEHEIIIARLLARGVIIDGLRVQSIDARWVRTDQPLAGYPFVGYSAKGALPVLLQAATLEHLLNVVRSAAEPSRAILAEDFIQRQDFATWLQGLGWPLPSFWFSESAAAAH